MKLLILSLLVAGSIQAKASAILDLSFDQTNNSLNITIAFQGGLKDHQFDLLWEPCIPGVVEGGPEKQTAARMIDTGWDDEGTEDQMRYLNFPLNDLSCMPAELTIFVDKTRRTIEIP